MSNELKNILSENNDEINNQKLLDYLRNQLSKDESHEVEKSMASDEFLNDAMEGLQEIKDQKNMQAYVEQLNLDLQKQTAKNKKRKEKRKLKDQPYTYLTIIIILLLAIVCFIVLKKRMDAKAADHQPVTGKMVTLSYYTKSSL